MLGIVESFWSLNFHHWKYYDTAYLVPSVVQFLFFVLLQGFVAGCLIPYKRYSARIVLRRLLSSFHLQDLRSSSLLKLVAV